MCYEGYRSRLGAGAWVMLIGVGILAYVCFRANQEVHLPWMWLMPLGFLVPTGLFFWAWRWQPSP